MTEQTTQTEPSVAAIAARIPTVAGRVQPNRGQVAEVTAFIAREFRPERIVLFGSRAYGQPHVESDVDLMVIMDTPLTSSQQAWAIRDAIRRPSWFAMDVHVRTPEQIDIGLVEGDFFIEDVMLQGFTLYERGSMGAGGNGEGGSTGEDPRGWPDLKHATREWLRKADGNARSAFQLLGTDDPNYDDVCFLAQQCVEKSFEALLQEREVAYPRTDDLETLVAVARPFFQEFAVEETRLRELSACAVDARYPGLDIDRAGAERAIQTKGIVLGAVRRALARRDRNPPITPLVPGCP